MANNEAVEAAASSAQGTAGGGLEHAGAALSTPEANSIILDGRAFQQRAAQQHLPPAEIIDATAQVNRIKESGVKDAARIAADLMHELAQPTSISQGSHVTCTAASAEEVLATKSPAKLAKAVADVALTGSTRLTNGMVITPKPADMQPDPPPTRPGEANGRSESNAIAQSILMEVGRVEHPKQSGMRTTDVPLMINAVSGRTDIGTTIAYDDPNAGPPPEKNAPLKIATEADLDTALKQGAARGEFPVAAIVNIGNQPFFTDSGGQAGGHAVVITGYKDGKVEVDTHWDGSRHLGANALSVHDLYMAMRPPTDDQVIADLKSQVEQNRKAGTISSAKELDLIRHQHYAGDTGEIQYRDAIAATMKSANDRWAAQKKSGTFNHKEYDESIKLTAAMIVTGLHRNNETNALIDQLKKSNPEINQYFGNK